MMKFICFFVVFVAAVSPLYAQATTPLQTVEDNVNQLLAVLGDKTLAGPDGEEKKKESIRSISNSLFDFYALSRRTLGANWKKFNPDQKKEFIILYRRLLESIYMDRLLQYQDEKVKFQKEITLGENRAEVHSAIVGASGDIPINYKMYMKDGLWKTYDLVVENVSMVSNYRSQFNSILSKKTPDMLLAIMREKVKDYS